MPRSRPKQRTSVPTNNARRPGQPSVPEPSQWHLPTSGPPPGTDIVAIGADLEPGTLLHAYRLGLFPMPFDRRRIAWFSPDPRGILPLDGLRITRSLRRSLQRYDVTINQRFVDVMVACADPSRDGAWIDDAFIAAYARLHELGWAHSVEVYHKDTTDLVGGLYGVRIERFFAGESMFHTATDASKVALVHLVHRLRAESAALLDVQWTTPHLISLGAIDVSRDEYLGRLQAALEPDASPPSWAASEIDELELGPLTLPTCDSHRDGSHKVSHPTPGRPPTSEVSSR